MSEHTDFDLVVFGESPAGLWAAKQLLTQGKKVMVVLTGTSRKLPSLPKFVVDDFGLEKHAKADRDLNPLQILTPQKRFRLFRDEKRFREEFLLQFGKPLSLQEEPPSAFLRGLAYWVRGSETAPVFPEEWPNLYARFFETVYFDEKPGFVTQLLIGDLERSGAKIIKAGNLRRVFVDRKTFVGVQLAQSSQMISAKTAFANTNLDYLNHLMNESLPFHSHPLAWRFEMNFECDPDSIPVGLSDRMLYIENQAPILEFFQSAPGKFQLQTSLPLREDTLNRGEQRRIAARMLKVCEGILPDLEYNIRKILPDLRDPERAMNTDLPALYPFQEVKKIPPALFTYGGGTTSMPPNPISGLWITYEEVNPREDLWGGFEGARAALKAFEPKAPTKSS